MRYAMMSFTHVAVDVGQAEVASLVAVSQLLVIDSEEVQTGRVEIVDVNRILGDPEAELVGRAVRVSFFDAAAGHPDAEAFLVVVAPRCVFASVPALFSCTIAFARIRRPR